MHICTFCLLQERERERPQDPDSAPLHDVMEPTDEINFWADAAAGPQGESRDSWMATGVKHGGAAGPNGEANLLDPLW